MSTCGEKTEHNYVVGWVWSKQKSLNPTLNIWNKICQVMLSSVFQFLHKSQLLFLIRNIQVFFHLILVIHVKFEKKKLVNTLLNTFTCRDTIYPLVEKKQNTIMWLGGSGQSKNLSQPNCKNFFKQNMPSQMLESVRQFLHKTQWLFLMKCFIIWSWWFWQMFLSVRRIGELAKLIGNDYWREKVWQTSDILDHISSCLNIKFD